MIYKRLIPVVLIKDGIVIQSFNFNKHLPIGKPKYIVDNLSSWDSDEIIVLDISSSKNKTIFNKELINTLSKHTNVPLTIGGGIVDLKSAELYFKNGADKISINSLFINKKYDIINTISKEYGAQSVVLSLDFIKDISKGYILYNHLLNSNTKMSINNVFDNIKTYVEVGEILINSVDRDGSKMGYDVDLLKKVDGIISNPILALGGANKLEHFLKISKFQNITGMCASNIFLHLEHSSDVFKNLINKQQNQYRENNYFIRN